MDRAKRKRGEERRETERQEKNTGKRVRERERKETERD